MFCSGTGPLGEDLEVPVCPREETQTVMRVYWQSVSKVAISPAQA